MKTWYQLIDEFKGYEPASLVFTSDEEIEKINKHFSLDEKSLYELRNLRDMFMLYFIECQHCEKKYSISAMQSVTCVIDLYITRKGAEV